MARPSPSLEFDSLRKTRTMAKWVDGSTLYAWVAEASSPFAPAGQAGRDTMVSSGQFEQSISYPMFSTHQRPCVGEYSDTRAIIYVHNTQSCGLLPSPRIEVMLNPGGNLILSPALALIRTKPEPAYKGSLKYSHIDLLISCISNDAIWTN